MYTRLYGQQAYENESGQMFSMRIICIWEFTRGSSEKFPEEFSLVTKPQYVAYPYGEISNHPALVFHAWNYSGFPRFIPSKARAYLLDEPASHRAKYHGCRALLTPRREIKQKFPLADKPETRESGFGQGNQELGKCFSLPEEQLHLGNKVATLRFSYHRVSQHSDRSNFYLHPIPGL